MLSLLLLDKSLYLLQKENCNTFSPDFITRSVHYLLFGKKLTQWDAYYIAKKRPDTVNGKRKKGNVKHDEKVRNEKKAEKTNSSRAK